MSTGLVPGLSSPAGEQQPPLCGSSWISGSPAYVIGVGVQLYIRRRQSAARLAAARADAITPAQWLQEDHPENVRGSGLAGPEEAVVALLAARADSPPRRPEEPPRRPCRRTD